MTDVTRYLEFKSVDGSYVFHGPMPGRYGAAAPLCRPGPLDVRRRPAGGRHRLHKVPANRSEALTSSLMGLFEKRRFAKFLGWAHDYNENDRNTWHGLPPETLMRQVYAHFGLDRNTADFTGHAIALYQNDEYLDRPCLEAIKKVQLYKDSLARYGKSPYIYPLYGLGELPQGFARLSAIYGGTYMLNRAVSEVVYDSNGVAIGVKSPNEKGEVEGAKCKIIVADPSYFPNRVKKIGQIARCICILSHPIPNTDNSQACQVIVPQNQVDRKSDIYISCVSSSHKVAANGKFIALVSTTVETSDWKRELEVGISLLGPVDERFFSCDDLLVPTDDGRQSHIFITESYDATSHFESSCDDIMRVYERATGEPLNLDKIARPCVGVRPPVRACAPADRPSAQQPGRGRRRGGRAVVGSAARGAWGGAWGRGGEREGGQKV